MGTGRTGVCKSKGRSQNQIRARANEICYKSTPLARDERGRLQLEFKELKCCWLKSLVNRGRAFLHGESGHIIQGWKRKMKEVSGIIK